MQTRIKRWGKSLALRIPKPFADDLGLADNSAVELIVSKGKLIVTPAPCPKLEDLIAGITDDNRHGMEEWRSPVGNEVW